MYYYNTSGHRYYAGERELEPWDCWHDEPSEPDEEEYDREEMEQNGRTYRNRAASYYP